MTKLNITIILLFLVACNHTNTKTGQIGFFDNERALWITDNKPLPVNDSLFYLDNPAPIFRKEFALKNNVIDAKLKITAAGYYKATLNGERVGKNILDPAWTDFSKRLYFSEYDVTDLIKVGKNFIGVTLGNGFYNPLPLRKWGRRNLRNDIKVGKPTFIAKLLINYKDGSSTEIVSDDTWKYTYGPISKNSVYIGVSYDARNKILGWDVSEFDDRSWKSAVIGTSPGGALQEAFFPPVQITREINPVDIYSPTTGTWIVDMGENFTGTYKIKLAGYTGDTISFRFGERVYEDGTLNPMTTVIGQIKKKGVGGPGAPDIAWQTDRYIVGDDTEDWFQPEFTYHVYRFMEITGLKSKPGISDIKGLAIHTNVRDNNDFSSSSALLNSIQDATERTFLSNLVSVQSDCAAREKFGYGGDLNATSESYIYNFDMQAFYRKTIYDWVDAMNETSFVDTAPFAGVKYCGISWESAFLITQYYLYLYYNDTVIVKELYSLNNQWMDKAARIHPNGMVDQGLSDHESLEPVPVELTGTIHYIQCARIMQQFAAVLEDKDNEVKYQRLADKLTKLVKARFWDQPVLEKINRQTLFSTLLYHGIVPLGEISAAKDSLLAAVRNGPSGHFNTGIFGTKYVLETLSKYVSPDVVFDIVNSTVYPGWGFMMEQGATTIWETWKESDDTFSNNHPMFGTVSEWYYRWLGGIQPDPENPGFRKFILAPATPPGLNFVQCTYESPLGPIVSNWARRADGIREFEMTIPHESIAKINLPVQKSQEVTIRSAKDNREMGEIEGLQSGNFILSGGQYLITVSSKK